MFTGIIETMGVVQDLVHEGENLHLTIQSSLGTELKIDQSVAHNGVCLTVVEISGDAYKVTAIKETLGKTNLDLIEIGQKVNLERAMVAGARLDGHMVQGHVDTVAVLEKMSEEKGSWEFHFRFLNKPDFFLVDKGSVCIDGVSLTVVKAKKKKFHVAIIPYTYENTLFHTYKEGQLVNIEFDILGKYIQQYMERMK